ncbi:tryptophan halogenase family protein [Pseudoalteromonas luteoviolacea]|uniref:tryptophan halogenase family protein n=1 Tax=Pseudoalteromonas luteoviolacea TaxID=43657 RepID=UPI0011527AC7|nr:tryptophan halogenase family protein [Pseudoalteromonas luteoviolacea]TQF70404.1 tryptophan 7-halogenase [Pseudoalteromonas luteoviolacea]
MASITIVGGGTAGWMTAVLLNQAYNKFGNTVSIQLVESPDVDIVGVGEATVPAIKDFLQAVGIDEAEFIKSTNATIKNGILFKNWCAPTKEGEVHQYMHPFDQERVEKRLDVATSWLLSSRNKSYDDSVSIAKALSDKNLTPKVQQSKSFQSIVPYSYHLDARLFGQFLRKHAIARGVTRVEAHVNNVVAKEGKIVSLSTDKGEITSDLFIDCTGFRALLMSKLEEQENWHSYSDVLLCDKAVTIQTANDTSYAPNPYTISHALSAGWSWKIDLQNRSGNGYVYSSRHISPEQAELEFRKHLGLDEQSKFNHIDMHVGRRRQQWIGNCVAVGLSSGFIEPLESTGLHLIYLAARQFVLHNNFSKTQQSTRDNYNKTMNDTYDELKDFIVLHYVLSDRTDSEFWRDIPKTLDGCELLKSRLSVWKHKVCEYFDVSNSTSHMFSDVSYRYILYGMNYFPELDIPFVEGEFDDVFAYIENRQQQACHHTLSHKEYLNATVHGQSGFVSVSMK